MDKSLLTGFATRTEHAGAWPARPYLVTVAPKSVQCMRIAIDWPCGWALAVSVISAAKSPSAAGIMGLTTCALNAAGFLPKSDPLAEAEAKPPLLPPMPPIYPEFQEEAFIPLAGFGGGPGEFAVGMPKERWASLLKTCPHILPPEVSESLLGPSKLCKHFKSFKAFAGFLEGCLFEFAVFQISRPEQLETPMIKVGCKEKSQVVKEKSLWSLEDGGLPPLR